MGVKKKTNMRYGCAPWYNSKCQRKKQDLGGVMGSIATFICIIPYEIEVALSEAISGDGWDHTVYCLHLVLHLLHKIGAYDAPYMMLL